MVQKEVAERLLAAPGDAEYGYLTVFRRLYADARKIATLSPASFFPRPKVWSAVVVLVPAERSLQNGGQDVLALASQSFRMRRKTLANNLAGWRGLAKPVAEECIRSSGLAPGIRAEQLALEDFDRLLTAVRGRTGETV